MIGESLERFVKIREEDDIMLVGVSSYKPPKGYAGKENYEVLDSLKEKYRTIIHLEMDFSVEYLRTGEISVTLEHEEGIYRIEILRGENKNEISSVIQGMLSEFQVADFEDWINQFSV